MKDRSLLNGRCSRSIQSSSRITKKQYLANNESKYSFKHSRISSFVEKEKMSKRKNNKIRIYEIYFSSSSIIMNK